MKLKGPSVAAAVAASVVAYRRWLGPWQQGWGATEEEIAAALPGDDLVAEPASQMTRATTIGVPREEVWPWIVQLGADRGGFYTYDWLQNLFGLDIHNADELVEEWQSLDVGDLVLADRAGSGGWYVMDLRPNETLVLKVANLTAGRPLRRDEKLRWEFVWTFSLRDVPDGATRLLIRERAAYDSALAKMLLAPVGLVSFVMTRGTLLGLKSRAESRGARPSSSTA